MKSPLTGGDFIGGSLVRYTQKRRKNAKDSVIFSSLTNVFLWDDGTVFYHLQLYPLHYGSGMFLCAN